MDRSDFLKFSLSGLALPMLESMSSEAKTSSPKRLVQLGYGFGHTKEYYPSTFGADYKLTDCLASLKKHQSDFTMINNLTHIKHRGVHQGCTVYLTGAQVQKPGQKFKNSVSCDQVAAQHMGTQTRFTSLQLSSNESGNGTGFGPGLSLSWDHSGKPLSGLTSPFQLYSQLFGGNEVSSQQKLAMLNDRKSILDIYNINIKSIKSKSSSFDKEKLDEYSQSIREIEMRIAKEKLWSDIPKPQTNYPKPNKNINGIEEIKTMYDLMILAMQTDSSRVITYRQPILSLLKALGFTYDGHQLSHYGGSEPRTTAALAKDTKQSELFSYFIDKLKTTKDVDGSRLFDNCIVSYGGNLRTGHMLSGVPCMITGNIDGRLQHGQHIDMPKDTALCNLWLTLLQLCEVPVTKFGDSNGTIEEILA